MATQRAPNTGADYFQRGDKHWDAPVIAATLALDAQAPVGGLCVSAASVDATTRAPVGLFARVAAGTFRKRDGSLVAVAPNPGLAVPPSATTLVWLDDTGVLQSGTAWPTSDHVRLASVVANATDVTAVTDRRVVLACSGGPLPTVTGSRGGNAALASLLTAGASQGLWTDGTTA